MNHYENYKMYNLTEEYIKISYHIQKFQSHIEMCHNNFIIKLITKNNHLKVLNECVKQLNLTYNTAITTNGEQPYILKNISNDKNINLKSTSTFLQLYDVMIDKRNNINYPYDKITNIITTKIAQSIGFPSISVALSMIINTNYKYFFNDTTNKLLSFYDSIFVPLGYSAKLNKQYDQILVESINTENFMLLHNCANIHIQHNDITITLSGYFIFDSLNIVMRTAEISNTELFNKKKEIEEILFLNTSVNCEFAKSYLRNTSICDIIVLSPSEYVNKLIENYNLYEKLIGLNLCDIMTEFIKEGMPPKKCLVNMFNIIKLLLLGHDMRSINIAEFLFTIIEEKKINTEILSPSEIIYKNLNYFLQLKLKKSSQNINVEIKKLGSLSDDTLAKQIVISRNMPIEVKKLAMEKAEEMKNSGSEHYKQGVYVKTLLNYPWPTNFNNNSDDDINIESHKIFPNVNNHNRVEFLNNIARNLDQKVCGHTECKNKIKELVGKWTINSFGDGSVLGLCGPPGVGKTMIAKSLSEVLGFPFVQINLSGQNDGELLYGHGYSYSSAQPGMIVKKMVEAGSPRCIMYFDELDKTCPRNGSNEITNILIHVTDPLTNSEFQDRFFQGINFPLNKVLFIFSYNDASNIDKILLDRIEQIKVGAFKLVDKKEIINKFIIKEMCDMICLDKNMVSFSDEVMEFIIDNYTNESGIRTLKRRFEKIFLKLNIDKIYGTLENMGDDNIINITKDYVKKCLGNYDDNVVRIHDNNMIGVINGMYATSEGNGGILPIQVYENYASENNNFTLKMTGSQKKVMRESVSCALTTAMNYVRIDIKNSYVSRNLYGFHVHVPETAVTKTGPSGGVAFTVAFISRILNRKIKNNISITGEIDLVGNVMKIGGLEYKLNGAKKAGVLVALVPYDNKKDIDKIIKDYPDLFINFEVKYAKTLKDVLQEVIIGYDESEMLM